MDSLPAATSTNTNSPQFSRTLSQSLPSSRRSSFKERRARVAMPQDSGSSLEDEFEKYFRMARLHEALAIVEQQTRAVPSITETKDPGDTDTTSLSSSESETSLERTASLNSSLARRKHAHAWRKSDISRRRQLRRSFHVKCPPNSVVSKSKRVDLTDEEFENAAKAAKARPRLNSLPSQSEDHDHHTPNHNNKPERPPHIRLLKPSVDLKQDMKQVRSYVITSKGLLKEDRTPSPSKEKLGSSRELIMVQPVTPDDFPGGRCHRVLLLGRSGVGKRALIREFMMPDHFFMSSADDDSEKYVSILLDGEESTLEFVDLSDQEVDSGVPAENIDAYVVVYSVEDSKSFQTALDRLAEIRDDEGREVAVILVANKSDLVRTRVIFEEEGKNAAKKYDCKYIEVSAAIDHKIDELLVGILKQIRLISDKYSKRRSKVSSLVQHMTGKGDCCPLGSTPGMLGKIFGKPRMTSKSCDNLYVL